MVARAHAPSIFQECRDYRRQQCRDQVSDQKLGAKLVTIASPVTTS
ncbi:TPA: hypothetical protein SJB77_002798 [Staphylococcus aureus]|nr:hypothetical protein [Staphylococcus aureus]